MSLPKFLNGVITRTQVTHPVLASKVIRRLTGSGGKKKGGDAASAAHPAPGASAASDASAAGRTDGIEAAKIAAGVPAAH